MGQSGHQDFWVAGSRFYFQRESDTNLGLLDLGVVSDVRPQFEMNKLELEDADGGMLRLVDETMAKISERYEITVKNLSPTNRSLLFIANEPEAFTQAAGAIAPVDHIVSIGVGKYVKILGEDGAWLFSIASAVITDDSVTPVELTEGDDWDWVSKDRGLIQFYADGTNTVADGDAVVITSTLNALTGKRLIHPQSAAGVIKGKALIVWGRGNNAYQTVREATVSLSPSGANIQVTDYSDFTLTATVLSDITEVTTPAGRMLDIKGAIPAAPASPTV